VSHTVTEHIINDDLAADRLTVTARTRAFGAGRRNLVSATPPRPRRKAGSEDGNNEGNCNKDSSTPSDDRTDIAVN
jgi:hypothetical protein